MQDNSCVLIESTANQCDQNGGYTGMTPMDFKNFVNKMADEIGFDKSKLFLGGDHLGPLTFGRVCQKKRLCLRQRSLSVIMWEQAFTKIHIDTSMKVADDDANTRLSDETIAKRGARLAKVAEETYKKLLETNPDAIEPVYIVGSEVPIPGGAVGGADDGVQVTKVDDFKNTVATFKKAFLDNGLDHAWENVIAVVVQPGVEEKDSGCTEYDREKAKELMASIADFPQLVFEGHSTDYQTKIKLRELVEDGVGISKGRSGTYICYERGCFCT